MSAAVLGAYVEGVGLLGPGLSSWAAGARILAGETPWVSAPTVLPPPEGLPPAERRRTGVSVKLALAAGIEATRSAGVDPAQLPAVFSSSGGDGQNCHEICQVLAGTERQLSPTRFHNSVHNAAAGYWGIATGATAACNALCAHDASFTAGLLEALTQVVTEERAVLLVAYDASYPEPLRAARPIPDAFAVALVLGPRPTPAAHARIEAHFTDAAPDILASPLESLRQGIPAARSLPLLVALARAADASAVLEYLGSTHMAVRVSACH